MSYLKPQSPLKHAESGDYFYPLTTVDQVVMEDGSRLNSVFKHTVQKEITLLASNWSSNAPYTQTITLDNYLDNLKVDANIVYSGIEETDLELNKAASCLSYIKKNGKNVTFYCLSSKPEIDIPIEISYESVNSIATVTIGTSEKIDLNEELAAQAELIGELQTTLQSKMSGNDLNFEIVGGLIQPTNPKENTIWVNTDTAISNYIFSVTKPTTMLKEGTVWICTNLTSMVNFDALNGDNINMIYPASVKQYINSTWVNKIAKTWKDNQWKEWLLSIFDNGIFGVDYLATTNYADLYCHHTLVDGIAGLVGRELVFGDNSANYACGGYVFYVDFSNVNTLKITRSQQTAIYSTTHQLDICQFHVYINGTQVFTESFRSFTEPEVLNIDVSSYGANCELVIVASSGGINSNTMITHVSQIIAE